MDDPYVYGPDHPIVNIIRDMLLAEGASTRDDATRLLPDVEQMLGPLTDRERQSVLDRFNR